MVKKLGELDPRLYVSREKFFLFKKEARKAITERRDI